MRSLPFSLVATLLLPAALQAQPDRQRVDTTFAFDKGGLVTLSLVSGEIRVVTGTGPDIRILASIERGRLETSFSRSRVSIEARSVNGRMGMTRYELTVPVGTRVDANSVSGDITIRGTGTEVEANSVSGAVRIENASGLVDVGTVSGRVDLRGIAGRGRVETVSGDVDVDDAAGELEVESVSGTIGVRRGRLRSLRTTAISGDLRYEGTLDAAGEYRFNAHSGEVAIGIPANGGAVLDLETWSGQIQSDFPLTLQPGDTMNRRNRRMQFTVGQGGARISAETFSGDIIIRRAPARGPEE